ncbi:MAG: hypothetical protein COT89_02735 [Candidatus Colwellbacteria bacterium CG10_big_fil_rev_8_21_14_0_10_42_22]|uniref:Penicillin-binding protein 2 n=1 Tax=Candidatus Colwellbacteria bacterium CG10_big_fil_rev_8_21_14_0_10_42_22 TaxID=1974540 RepID=A0A2H0VFB9_9BACT|nr:MAG: hypothetical protein COT89_02735 [Candidatus Colwellbacteria bacterium CG10_big_fil_rev_8_21_14_0_10_42_22]
MPRRRKRNIDFDQVISDSMSGSALNLVETLISNRVFSGVLLGAFIIAGVFGIRSFSLAGLKGQEYLERSRSNTHQSIPLVAPRGTILDRYGNPITDNKAIFSVFLHVDQMMRNEEKDSVVRAVNDILGVDEETILKLVRETNLEDITDIIIAEDISREQVIAIESSDLKSLNVEQSFKRDYKNPAFSHLVGYVGLVSGSDLRGDDQLVLNDYIGRDGLEMQYDSLLRGKNGKVTLSRSSSGEITEILRTKEPIQGEILETTIDADLQKYFHSRMANALVNLGRTSGVGIIINPANGEILALISFPEFDGNNISDYITSPSKPLFNRAVSGVYNPGSTIKPMHATAALNEGIISPEKQIYSAGYIELPNPYDSSLTSRFVDWKPHGWVDVYSALARSSNVYFYVIGGGFQDQIGLGINRLYEYWNRFGFGEVTGIDMPGESVGFLPTPDEKEERTGQIWRVGDTYNVSIGQGDLSITPLRLVSAVSAIANGGPAYVPHIKKDISQETLYTLKDMEEALSNVRRGMIDAVTKDYGTANLLSSIPMVIGAKTGSAQVASKTKTNALITAYASRDAETSPEIVMLVLVEDAREGSLNTVPIARDVLQWYYDNRVNVAENAQE